MTVKNRANKVKNDAEENLRLRRPCQTKISVVGVLGLAPCHDSRKQMNKTLQVRQRDVSLWYHCDFWPSSLAQEPESHLCLLLVYITKSRSFTLFRCCTHTHTSHHKPHCSHKARCPILPGSVVFYGFGPENAPQTSISGGP